MPESRSALASHYTPGRYPAGQEPGVRLREIRDWDLVQVAGWRGCEEALWDRVAGAVGTAPALEPNLWTASRGIELMTVAPGRLWCIAPLGDDRLETLTAAIDMELGCTTALGHSHVRLRLEGPGMRRLLAQEIAIDLAPRAFPAGCIARTSMHHVPVLLQAIDTTGNGIFDLYLPHTFAVSAWTYLLDLGRPYGYEIAEAESRWG